MNEATSCDERKLSLPVPPATGGEFGGGHAEPDDAGIAIACGAKRTHFPCLQKMSRRHYTTPREHSPWVGYFALLK